MKFIGLLIHLIPLAHGFLPGGLTSRPAIISSHTSLNALATDSAAKAKLITVADRIKADDGIFVYDSSSKSELEEAVAELEAVGEGPTAEDYEKLFQGDWELVCTTATNGGGIDTSRLPFLKENPLKTARQSLNARVKVIQKIKSTTGDGTVDRVDHVIEYEPPESLESLLGEVPDFIKSLNFNPFELTKSKVTLVHKAEVESVTPLTTKLSLQSVILNVAGKSQFLDPAGADVLGVNVPLGEFLNAGTFETTYMDDTIRISRGKVGGVIDQLRVFVRAETTIEAEPIIEADIDEEKFDEKLAAEFEEVEWVEDGTDDSPSDVEPSDDGSPSDS